MYQNRPVEVAVSPSLAQLNQSLWDNLVAERIQALGQLSNLASEAFLPALRIRDPVGGARMNNKLLNE